MNMKFTKNLRCWCFLPIFLMTMMLTAQSSCDVLFNFIEGQTQTYIVPSGVTSLSINTVGGDGYTGGYAASMSGDFEVSQGDVLTIIVGGQGKYNEGMASGGAGSGVLLNGIPLIVAGGGGGGPFVFFDSDYSNKDASLTEDGYAGQDSASYMGDSTPSGSGGTNGGNGGDFIFAGENENLEDPRSGSTNRGGKGWLDNLNGSFGENGIGTYFPNNVAGPTWGLGGGGGASTTNNGFGGGGGGGYSGGGAGGIWGYGGGGGSFNSGQNQNNFITNVRGDGYIVISGVYCDEDEDGIADEDDNCPYTSNPDQADNDNDGIGNICDSTPDGVNNIAQCNDSINILEQSNTSLISNNTTSFQLGQQISIPTGTSSIDGFTAFFYNIQANAELTLSLYGGTAISYEDIGVPIASTTYVNEVEISGETTEIAFQFIESVPVVAGNSYYFYITSSSNNSIYYDYDSIMMSNLLGLQNNQIIYEYSGYDLTFKMYSCGASIADMDGDGIADEDDNCPDTANADQADADGDLVGDVCDDTPNGDDDNDGVDNAVDVCPGSDDTIDTDQDGTPDGCDDTPNGDDDNDGVDNAIDACPGSDDTIDSDQDGTPDGCDETPNGDDDNGNGNGETVTICHIPPGNPNNPQTITVSVNALQAHLNHGDALGECEIEDNEPTEGCYAAEVIAFEQGQNSNGNAVAANRGDATTALGEPDRSNAAGGFVSLGINGYLTLQFAGAVYNADGDDIMIYETSFSGDDCSGASDERAMVEVSQDGATWFNAGEICRDGGIDLQGIPVVYVTHIRITDITTGSGDGFDVDGVEILSGCQNTPDEENDVCYGAFVVENSYTPGPKKNGQAITDPSRLDPSKALGGPEGDDSFNFVSLGYGGEIAIGFDGAVLNQSGADLEVVETTFGSQDFDSYAESADVYVSQDGTNFFMIGSVMTDESASLDISNASVYLSYITHVKLVDTTPGNSVSTDGFDLDGIVALPGCTLLEITEGSATNLNEFAALSTTDQTFANVEVKMYPVPARDILNVKLQNYAGGAASYEIVSLMGQTFIKGSLKAASEFNADVSNLSDGAYFLLIHANGETINRKFVKATK